MLEVLEMSSALGEHLREFRERAALTQEQLANRSKGVARTTVSAIELGIPMKLDTVRLLADALKLNTADWTTLLIDWLRIELGDEFNRVDIRPRDSDELHAADTAGSRLQRLLLDLSPRTQEQMLAALERPEVRDAIPALTRIYDAGAEPKRQTAPLKKYPPPRRKTS
jgi:transcriptional regulator with XRE-family HTH domain